MEKENKLYFVYKTTNLKNGKFYVGVHETYNLNGGYLGSGKVLRNSIYFHGKENFKREIIEFCEDKKSMYEKEKELATEELVNNIKCMNLTVGGVGFIDDEKHRKISSYGGKARAKKIKEDPEFRDIHNKIVGETMRKNHMLGKIKYNTFTGKKHSEETKKKMREVMKGKGAGKKNSQYGTCWITKNGINKKIKKEELDYYISKDWARGRISIFQPKDKWVTGEAYVRFCK